MGQLTATPVTQTFTVTENSMKALEVMFSNFNERVETGTLTLTLTDEAGNVLAQQDYPVADLKNNAFITLTLPCLLYTSSRYAQHNFPAG